MTERPPGRRPEGAHRAAPSRLDADEPLEKVAPWREWAPVTLRASSGGEHPVRFTVSGLDDDKNARYSELITSAAHEHFKMENPPREDEGPAAYLVEAHAADERSPAVELLRVVYKELVVQFKPDVDWAKRNAILDASGFRTVERSFFARNKWIVRPVRPGMAGESLLAAADAFKEFEDVEYAWPNSLAEYVRANRQAPLPRDWWLERMGVIDADGNRLDPGDAGVFIAIIDDGVDIDHPNLVSRVAPGGRDFNFLSSHPNYSNPRPKVKAPLPGNSDYHGTSCAGVICSDGTQMEFVGVAPGCRLIALRMFNGVALVSETTMANAIDYARGVAHVISCSWGGLWHTDIDAAINNTKLGREGRGSVFVCSTGNLEKSTIDYPASHCRAVAVGACGPNDEVTDYTNYSDKLDVVAPSSWHNDKVYSTDVSQPDWGYSAGLFANVVGKTSAAAAMAAGVAALCLSANPNLTAGDVRSLLRRTAAKVGVDGNHPVVYNPPGPEGRSLKLGSGRIDAAAAVAEAQNMLDA